MLYTWEMHEANDFNDVEKLANELDIPLVIAKLLVLRNIIAPAEALTFFDPAFEHLHQPLLMKDMELAVRRILKALRNNDQIVVFGDYDVDGTTAASILFMVLSQLSAKVNYYIPDRFNDGYGLKKHIIDRFVENDCKLIITVDCGITACEEVLYARNHYQMDVIICDHHQTEKVPEAIAVLNPKRTDETYPFKDLAGCGVAFKLCQAIFQELKLPFSELEKHLDLVCVGSAADIVPIRGENRYFVKRGLEIINENPSLGLKILMKSCKINRIIDTSTIVFNLAPRINAVGRMGNPLNAVKLLTTNDYQIAENSVKIMESDNYKRKKIDEQILMETATIIEDHINLEESPSLILYNENWHPGVIGIIASRLVEKYNKPSIMLTIEDGIAKGSARSIPEINIYEILKKCADLLINFGGHHHAAGLSMETANIKAFQRKFNEELIKLNGKSKFIKKLCIDSELLFSDITPRFVRLLKLFEPFGPDNMTPVFCSSNLKLASDIKLINQKHLMFSVKQNKICIDAIAFNMNSALEYLYMNSEKLSFAYSLHENIWAGKKTIQLRIKDYH